MAGTYSQIYIQVVFAVYKRENILDKAWRTSVHKYISGIITGKGHKAIIVNGVGDHVHCLIGMKPNMSVSDLVRDIKNNSSKYINENKLVRGKFRWQEGYGVFSYAQSQVERVYQYILNQEEHHRKITFREEYEEFLRKFKIEFKTDYLFEWIE